MKQFLLFASLLFAVVANSQQSQKLYLYGLNYVHNSYIKLDSDHKLFFKAENSKVEKLVKQSKPFTADTSSAPYFLFPSVGVCKAVRNYDRSGRAKSITLIKANGDEMLFMPLQNCDKPGKPYPIKCK